MNSFGPPGSQNGTGPDAHDARPEGPSQVYAPVAFEGEEKARAREQDPRRQETLQAARAVMADPTTARQQPGQVNRKPGGKSHGGR
jgi:hypothetical protein